MDAGTIDWMDGFVAVLIEIWNGNWLECDYMYILNVLEGSECIMMIFECVEELLSKNLFEMGYGRGRNGKT